MDSFDLTLIWALSLELVWLVIHLCQEKVWLDYAVRVKSISVLRAHFKRANASTFEEERMKALHHHRFSKYMLSACQKTPSEWASGDNEKDCLTDLRQFMVWLHDCASSTDPHDRQLDDQDNAVKSGDQSLEEMVKTGELQAVLGAGDVRRDPASQLRQLMPRTCCCAARQPALVLFMSPRKLLTLRPKLREPGPLQMPRKRQRQPRRGKHRCQPTSRRRPKVLDLRCNRDRNTQCWFIIEKKLPWLVSCYKYFALLQVAAKKSGWLHLNRLAWQSSFTSLAVRGLESLTIFHFIFDIPMFTSMVCKRSRGPYSLPDTGCLGCHAMESPRVQGCWVQ